MSPSREPLLIPALARPDPAFTPRTAPGPTLVAPPRRAAPPHAIPALRVVIASDVIVVLAALLAVIAALNFSSLPSGVDQFLAMRVTVKNVLVLGFMVAGVVITARWAGLYDARKVNRWTDEMRRVLAATTGITAVATIVPMTSRSGAVDHWALLFLWLVASAALIVSRRVRASLARTAVEPRRVLIVGSGPHGLRIYRELCADVLTRYRVVGFIDDVAETSSPFLARRTLGQLEQLEQLLAREQIDEVYIGLPVRSHYQQIQDTIRTCECLGVTAIYAADIFDTGIAKSRLFSAPDAMPRVQLQMVPDGARLIVKRAIDIAGAAAAIVLFGPVMLAAAIAVRLTSGGPVIYAQDRCGLNRRCFRMHKFRTMVREADALQASLESHNEAAGPVFKIANDPRITRVGRFLRKSSIDELPQLFNVLRGDMSLVGPRPLPLRDVTRFTRTGDLRRFSMRPGITCLWQIGGRSGIAFEEWVQLDLQYIDQWSLTLDLTILARTVPSVLRGTGAA